jgi:hypothetical protein
MPRYPTLSESQAPACQCGTGAVTSHYAMPPLAWIKSEYVTDVAEMKRRCFCPKACQVGFNYAATSKIFIVKF